MTSMMTRASANSEMSSTHQLSRRLVAALAGGGRSRRASWAPAARRALPSAPRAGPGAGRPRRRPAAFRLRRRASGDGGVIVPVPPGISPSALATLSASLPGWPRPPEPVTAGSPILRSSFIGSEPNAGRAQGAPAAGGAPRREASIPVSPAAVGREDHSRRRWRTSSVGEGRPGSTGRGGRPWPGKRGSLQALRRCGARVGSSNSHPDQGATAACRAAGNAARPQPG